MTWILILSGIAALADWFAVGLGRRRIEVISKPTTLLLLILWFVLSIGGEPGGMAVWIALGLGFSLLGDVFLLRSEKWFIYGLVAFLFAQVCYAIGLNAEGLVLSGRSAAAAVAIAALAILIFSRIRAGLRRSGKEKMIAPVAVYVLAIGVMLWSAACAPLRPGWPGLAAALIAVGGALFFASDGILAWDRFVKSFPAARLLTMVTYHLAQYGLAIGTMMVIGGM
jgi:uncharacterized membrane protein YhhN